MSAILLSVVVVVVVVVVVAAAVVSLETRFESTFTGRDAL
jgi:hypothetical protein